MDIYSNYHIQNHPKDGLPYVGTTNNLKRRAGEHEVSENDVEILFQTEFMMLASVLEQELQRVIIGKSDGHFYHLLDLSEERNRKISDAMKGVMKSPDHRQAISDATQGRIPWNKGLSTGPASQESIDKRKETRSQPEVEAKRLAAFNETNKRQDVKDRRSKSNKEAQNRPEVQDKRRATMKEVNARPEVKAKHREAAKNRPNKECPHCHRMLDSMNYGRYHGDKCKMNKSNKETG